MSARQSSAEDPAYAAWLGDVADLVRRRLGLRLGDLPELPFRDGFSVGDSAAEFYAGCVVPAVVEGADSEGPTAASWPAGNEPAWPPPG